MTGIINYGAGNIFSLTAALERLHIPYGMVNTQDELAAYDRIVIPGVGHAGTAMRKLQASGLAEPIRQLKKPVLGICVGMQLLTSHSEEGNSPLLDIVPLKTLHFENRIAEKVPHMGWNKVFHENRCALFADIKKDAYFYFVHSYFIEYNATFTAAFTEYGLKFSASLQDRNFYGVQFHPEKSGEAGEQLLLNFSNLH
ncbi:imidazole glycerol phosphate synthase subunit HisH [Parapedobacter defluvii]|uniref:Imidazole glycerol phosphate synthase subunit HisH n=1 Tax=Parapedobacter defluvii TaxID=2045106 RepID=A0ABQ1KZ67_9SPHI|nr:imidazole glycerol phosphate synthase subunit HisH [Parapedobacter defluvii]RQP09542.1 MAG: imidazole glycerol phosphate synthase subunit HisH [Parapedobacter sp.]GGC15697.1 imidazole glycerol phosphate synthase subunit HisH [Parapedobacter defluvii]